MTDTQTTPEPETTTAEGEQSWSDLPEIVEINSRVAEFYDVMNDPEADHDRVVAAIEAWPGQERDMQMHVERSRAVQQYRRNEDIIDDETYEALEGHHMLILDILADRERDVIATIDGAQIKDLLSDILARIGWSRNGAEYPGTVEGVPLCAFAITWALPHLTNDDVYELAKVAFEADPLNVNVSHERPEGWNERATEVFYTLLLVRSSERRG